MGRKARYGDTYITQQYKIVIKIEKIKAIMPYINNPEAKARLEHTKRNLIYKMRNLRVKDENGKYIKFDDIDDDDIF